jgi:hypothetical protein
MVAHDPRERREIARRAGKARHSTEVYIKALVDRAPELSAEQRDKLASLLRTTAASNDREAVPT